MKRRRRKSENMKAKATKISYTVMWPHVKCETLLKLSFEIFALRSV